MNAADQKAFSSILSGMYALHRQDLSPALISIWLEAMRPFDFATVKDAMNRHAVNPDNGQYCPKPSDIVRLINGGTADAALLAWAKVERGVSAAGAYRSVVFDDPIIHAVLSDMGGWAALCAVAVKDLPFRAKEFENRYRAYRLLGGTFKYPALMTGIHDTVNEADGFRKTAPVFIGNQDRAADVLRLGSSTPMIEIGFGNVTSKLENKI